MPFVHFEISGQDPQKLRSFNGDLFGWEFDTSAPVAETISQRANCRFVNRDTTDDWVGILRGAGGSPSYHGDAIFYIGFPTSQSRSREPRPRRDARDGINEEPSTARPHCTCGLDDRGAALKLPRALFRSEFAGGPRLSLAMNYSAGGAGATIRIVTRPFLSSTIL
jgi:hypothetical protein